MRGLRCASEARAGLRDQSPVGFLGAFETLFVDLESEVDGGARVVRFPFPAVAIVPERERSLHFFCRLDERPAIDAGEMRERVIAATKFGGFASVPDFMAART